MKLYNPKQYLAIDIANHADKDKLLFDERIQWVKDNYNNLESLEPESNKLKFMYRKAVKALRDTDAGKPTGHLLSLDSVNSGVQLLTILMKCKTTANTCGLINNGTRPDVYTEILNKISVSDISRTQIKEAIIPMLYGSIAKPKELFGEDTPELEEFKYAVHKTIPALGVFTDNVKLLWNPQAKFHQWIMPDNHVVKLPTIVTKIIRVRAEHTVGTSFSVQYKDIEPDTNYVPLLSGIVHATDAYVCRQVIRKLAKKNIEVLTIHDSFWVSPLYGNELRWTYIETLAEIAKSDLFNDIASQLKEKRISTTFPNPNLYKEIFHAEYPLS